MTTDTFDRTAALDKAREAIKSTRGDEVTKRATALRELKAEYPDLPAETAEELMVKAAESMGRRGKITWASEYEMRNVRWLWENRIPLGMLSGLYGVEGMGKSMETARIAAAVTRGDLPGALEGIPRRVLIATTEDGWRETIAPRLKAAGADMSMVGHYRVTDDDGSDEAPELPRDAHILAEDVRGHEVSLVILDPVVSHLDSRAESHKTKDVRKALEPLHRVAEQEGFAVLGIMHFNKEKSTDPRQRSQMSSAFREVFRSTLVFGPDPDALEDTTRRVVALDKNTLVPPQPSYRMQIEGVTLEDADPDTGEPIQTARIVLGDECSYTANELLEAAAGNKPKTVSEAADQARRFLRERLAAGDGATPIKETQKEAAAAGISTTALEKARKALKLGTRRIKDTTDHEWYSRADAGEELEF